MGSATDEWRLTISVIALRGKFAVLFIYIHVSMGTKRQAMTAMTAMTIKESCAQLATHCFITSNTFAKVTSAMKFDTVVL